MSQPSSTGSMDESFFSLFHGQSPVVPVLAAVVARMFLEHERSACACVSSHTVHGDSNRRERAVCPVWSPVSGVF